MLSLLVIQMHFCGLREAKSLEDLFQVIDLERVNKPSQLVSQLQLRNNYKIAIS